MKSRALLLLAAVLAAGVLVFVLGPGAADESRGAARRSAPSGTGDAAWESGAGRSLTPVAGDARERLGLAATSFLPAGTPAPDPREEPDLSYDERALRERFESPGFQRLANAAAFVAPPGAEDPEPAPAGGR